MFFRCHTLLVFFLMTLLDVIMANEKGKEMIEHYPLSRSALSGTGHEKAYLTGQ